MTRADDELRSIWLVFAISSLAGAAAAVSYASWLSATAPESPQFNVFGYAILGMRGGACGLVPGLIIILAMDQRPYSTCLGNAWTRTISATVAGALMGLLTLALHLPDEVWEVMTS